MGRRVLFGSLGGVVVILAVLVGVWWAFIRSTAEPAKEPLGFRDPTASPSPGLTASPSDAASSGTPAAGTPSQFRRYVVVPEHPAVEGKTEAWYLAGETLARVGVPSTAKGTTTEVTGEFVIGPEGLDPHSVSRVVVRLANLRSDESRRDARVREALDVSRYPEATFTLEAIEGWPGEIPEGTDVNLRLRGVMELRGVQRELVWEAVARRRGEVITALATTRFRYADFNIPVPNIAGFVSVEEDVTVQVQLIAVAQ